MGDTTTQYSTQPGGAKKKNPVILIVVVIIAALLAGTVFLLQQQKKTDEPEVAVVEQEPTPTEQPEIDKKSVKIQVVNGTGTPGQAGIAVDALEEEGYDPDNIKTANAEEFDSTDTTITARDGFEDIASNIEGILKDTFDSIEIESTPLDKDSEFDIIIVTGGKKFESVTPTTKVSPNATATPSQTSITVTSSPTSSPTPTP